jgi:hypothetical protein
VRVVALAPAHTLRPSASASSFRWFFESLLLGFREVRRLISDNPSVPVVVFVLLRRIFFLPIGLHCTGADAGLAATDNR